MSDGYMGVYELPKRNAGPRDHSTEGISTHEHPFLALEGVQDVFLPVMLERRKHLQKLVARTVDRLLRYATGICNESHTEIRTEAQEILADLALAPSHPELGAQDRLVQLALSCTTRILALQQRIYAEMRKTQVPQTFSNALSQLSNLEQAMEF